MKILQKNIQLHCKTLLLSQLFEFPFCVVNECKVWLLKNFTSSLESDREDQKRSLPSSIP